MSIKSILTAVLPKPLRTWLSQRLVQTRHMQFRCAGIFRRNWPPRQPDATDQPNVAAVVVNFNTAEHIAALIFSLCRILGRNRLTRIVVVDNGSTDSSPALLRALAQAGLIDVIFNRRQRYHGPALTQAVNYLARLCRQARQPQDVTDYIWVLDSDVIVLRSDILDDTIAAMRQADAALAGQFQPDPSMAQPYAHISSLLLDPVAIWRRPIPPFVQHGAPAFALQEQMLRRGLRRVDFPFRAAGYLIHLTRATLNAIYTNDDQSNRYFQWAQGHHDTAYHGDEHGPYLHKEFAEAFAQAEPELSPETLVAACQVPDLINLDRPAQIARTPEHDRPNS